MDLTWIALLASISMGIGAACFTNFFLHIHPVKPIGTA
jgi:hypothetical protein